MQQFPISGAHPASSPEKPDGTLSSPEYTSSAIASAFSPSHPVPTGGNNTSPTGPLRNGVKRGFEATVSAEVEPSTKRLQMSGYGQPGLQGSQLSPTSPSSAAAMMDNGASMQPSRVVLLRNLHSSVNDLDVEQLVAPFCRGYRPKIYLQASAGHAFVEFADEPAASAALHYLKMHPIPLKGTVVQATFSRRDSVTTLEEKIEPFRVVLASVTNIVYSVDIDLINFLFSKYGVVEKIVTFSKTPTMYQALVQFTEADQAKAAMVALHNRNIYDGCNSLQIQPSRLQELTVKVNSAKSWDYTSAAQQQLMQPHQGSPQQFTAAGGAQGGAATPGAGGPLPSSLLPTPQAFGHMDMSTAGMPSMLHMHQAQQMQMQQLPHQHHPQLMGQMGQGMGPGMVMGGMHPHAGGMRPSHAMLMDKLPRELKDINLDAANPNQTPVVIVYNLSAADITVMKLFNLFSLYGTVLRIKILREKQDTALIQFSDPLYATIAYNFLQGAPVFQEEQGIQIAYSKNTEVKSVRYRPTPQGAGDSEADMKRTRAFGMRDQRYGQSDDVEKYLRGASRPMSTLFIANIHEDATEEEMRDVFSQYGDVRGFKFRPAKEGSRKRMAFVELGSDREAILALCNLHNYRLHEANIKIAFSKTNIGQAPDGPPRGAPSSAA